ncbi:hypothetical protein UFOVP635_30 [uncultured Caudovirales phage]|uniref:Uncharacterized protein n=1 Tax=uncultured Caudovirales phage TaxID=2100421 RepID=A0A6J5N2H9_9CAUD|nr:hypothetical protein UFOVP635_30 [uncultured Caudovirales phage]
MAFIGTNNNVLSFAEYEDVLATDQRLFEANEGLSEVIVEDACVRATDRILTLIRASDWWREYYTRQSKGNVSYTSGMISVPAPNPNKILARQADFTDLAVYYALAEILLPKVADFGQGDNAERQKILFYNDKYKALLQELLDAGDWYDFSGDAVITNDEKMPSRHNIVRVR